MVRFNNLRHKSWWRQTKYQAASLLKEMLYTKLFWWKVEQFALSNQIWSQSVPLILIKKTSTHTLCIRP